MSTVHFGSPDREPRTASAKAVRLAVACALIGLAAYVVYGTGLVAVTPRNVGIGAGIFVTYLLVAYFVDLEPDYENLGEPMMSDHSGRLPILGWFRFNDPFDWSDNVSREFLFWRLMLSPGRFISIALTDPFFARRKRRYSKR